MKARPLGLVLAAAVLFAGPLAARPVSGIVIEVENVRLCTAAGGGGKSCLQAASTTPVPGQVFRPGELFGGVRGVCGKGRNYRTINQHPRPGHVRLKGLDGSGGDFTGLNGC